jgi:predicted site-specific integrase-resolvase
MTRILETVAVTSKLTGVPERTIRNWIRDGRITAQWYQGKRLVSPIEVSEVAEYREQTGRLPNLPRVAQAENWP